MKSIALKLDDAVFEETEEILKNLKTSRNRYVNEAISHFNKIQRRKQLEAQLTVESALVSENSVAVLHEFEAIDEGF